MRLAYRNIITSVYLLIVKKLIKGVFLGFFLSVLLSSCSYLKYASIQAEYSRIQEAEPGQVNLKHMLERERYFVSGKIVDSFSKYADMSLVVVAYSSKFIENERVDTMFLQGPGTHYGLGVPEGRYTLIVLADKNNDYICDPSEVVGLREIVLDKTSAPQKVLARVDIPIGLDMRVDKIEAISIPNMNDLEKSLFFPSGSIRQLDDHIFDESVATLGMYDPASFSDKAPTMFFVLEEDFVYKIPIVFVHGIGGTPRSFSHIVQRLDRTRYKPWFFYYPSGGDLDQLAEFFFKIYLSGEVAHLDGMPMIVVVHSMGGLIIREALNKYKNKKKENKIKLFITIASPLGGHPAAASGEKHGLIVLPSWRDVNPNSRFIKRLYRKPLPEFVDHHLLYAYQNDDTIKLSENSDGVVPLSSQLHLAAQNQSNAQFGFNSNHTSILENEKMINYLIEQFDSVKNIFPAPHLAMFSKGGFKVELGKEYDPKMEYIIQKAGRYLVALSTGEIEPILPQQGHFIQVARGGAEPSNQFEEEWMRFLTEEYPNILKSEL